MIERRRANEAIKRLRAELRAIRSQRNALWWKNRGMHDKLANAEWREQHLLKEYYELKGVDFEEIDRLNMETLH